MASSRRPGGRSRLTLILLVLTSITVLTLDFRGSAVVRQIRGVAGTVFSPVRGAADTVFGPFSDAWEGAFEYDDVRRENEELRRELEELKASGLIEIDAQTQLEQLQKQLELPVLSSVNSVTARVSSGRISNFDHTIEIDKGSSVGIGVGMPVVANGLVGRVVQVTGNRSVIRLITDPELRVGVKLASTQTIGVATGQGEGSPLRVPSIPPATTIADGEVVTTSGQSDSLYPPDILVGTVVTKETSADQLEQVLTVEPAVDVGRLSYVSVLLYTPPVP